MFSSLFLRLFFDFPGTVPKGNIAMFEQMIKVSASWDWVTPVIAFVQDWWYRPSTGFNMPYGHSYSAWEIKRFLKSKGIRVWGTLVVGDTITIRVREAQALYTEYWLQKMGIPYQGGLSLEKAEQYRRAQSRKGGASTPTPDVPKKQPGLASILDAIEAVVDGIASGTAPKSR
jgi:hypothetical protein